MKKSIKIVAIVLSACLVAGLFAAAIYEIYVAVLKVQLADLRQSEVRYVAHRGLSSQYPENTIEAFVAAGESPSFYGIETDLWATADGEYVLAHDEAPFAGTDAKIGSLTYAECSKLPLKKDEAGTARIPTLDQYLDICKRYDKVAFLELKQVFSKEELKQIKQICLQKLPAEKLVLMSFKDANLKRLAKDDVPFGLLQLFNSRFWVPHNANLGYSVGVKYTAINKGMVDTAHGLRVAVAAWTVNTVEEAQKYEQMGVDYIITNYDLPAMQA